MVCALVDTRREKAMGFDNIHNLLYPVSIPLVNVVVEQLVHGEWRRWRQASPLSGTLVFVEQSKGPNIAKIGKPPFPWKERVGNPLVRAQREKFWGP